MSEMIQKSFKNFHSAIENDIAASMGDFAIDSKSALANRYSEVFVRLLRLSAKRILDLTFASVFLLISLPFFIIIAIAIKATSRGTVFFRQERIGYKSRTFKIWKFRTMRAENSEKEHKAYVESLLNQSDNPNDPELVEKYVQYLDSRITPIGHFLRASSLDELPQLFNILVGDMSLVGPRPHPTYEVSSYKKWYRRRLDVKPGLTGWSKLNLRFTPENYEEAILFDLWYVDNWNLGLDLRILVMTIPFVLSMKDAT
jgi:lipopolysaccharide/colanic/teichoic acid biosynthesis glycosyltransferase